MGTPEGRRSQTSPEHAPREFDDHSFVPRAVQVSWRDTRAAGLACGERRGRDVVAGIRVSGSCREISVRVSVARLVMEQMRSASSRWLYPNSRRRVAISSPSHAAGIGMNGLSGTPGAARR